jgi:hypothetical protein
MKGAIPGIIIVSSLVSVFLSRYRKMDESTSKVFILPFHIKQQYIKENEKNIFEEPEVSYLKKLDEELKRVLDEPGLSP